MHPTRTRPPSRSRWLLVVAATLALLAPLTVATAIVDARAGSSATVDQALVDSRVCVIEESYVVFLARRPTATELDLWMDRFTSGTPTSALASTLANSEEWLEKQVVALYDQALDRYPEAAGLAYWVAQLRKGVLVNAVGTSLYGSNEFYRLAGSTVDGFVSELYTRILHREADLVGLDYWGSQVARSGRGPVAARFFASSESRRDRVLTSYDAVLHRAPDPAGLSYWMTKLLAINDVALVARLAASSEFATKSQITCGEPRALFRYAAMTYDFYGVDDEWLADDEIFDPPVQYSGAYVNPRHLSRVLVPTPYRWGGEVRVEYRITFVLLPDGSIRVTMEARLFEGDTEDSADLDGQASIQFDVAPGAMEYRHLGVSNTDEGGDNGHLTVTVANTAQLS